MQYELQLKGDEARKRGRRRHKIHNVKLTSAKTQFQETQSQGTSQSQDIVKTRKNNIFKAPNSIKMRTILVFITNRMTKNLTEKPSTT